MPVSYMRADLIYQVCSSQVGLDDVDVGVRSCERHVSHVGGMVEEG